MGCLKEGNQRGSADIGVKIQTSESEEQVNLPLCCLPAVWSLEDTYSELLNSASNRKNLDDLTYVVRVSYRYDPKKYHFLLSFLLK